MSSINFNNAEFVKSAANYSQFIQSSVNKIAFAGKSNVGKSSVINCLLNRKNLAKVGSDPGKTIHVNYFLIDDKIYFVDLPGYGYAKVAKSERARWAELMEKFFSVPGLMDMGVFVVDSRHKPTSDDITMAEFFKNSKCRFVVVANKIDKLKKTEVSANLDLIRSTLSLDNTVPVVPFSAEKGFNRDKLLDLITLI